MKTFLFEKNLTKNYAEKWALSRNPQYYDFSKIGGDCTNFASQCLLAGAPSMNFIETYGWYYKNINDRSPSWTSVKYFYEFIINNKGVGPFGKIVNIKDCQTGDFIQLSNGTTFYHTLVVTNIFNNVPYVCAHSFDALFKPLTQYKYNTLRCIRIDGYRK